VGDLVDRNGKASQAQKEKGCQEPIRRNGSAGAGGCFGYVFVGTFVLHIRRGQPFSCLCKLNSSYSALICIAHMVEPDSFEASAVRQLQDSVVHMYEQIEPQPID